MNQQHREVRPQVERLEERSLLAVGTATLVGKTLVIQGPTNGGDGEGDGASAINVRVVEKGNKVRVIFTDADAANAQTIVEFKESRVKKANLKFKYYNAALHRACFALPSFMLDDGEDLGL